MSTNDKPQTPDNESASTAAPKTLYGDSAKTDTSKTTAKKDDKSSDAKATLGHKSGQSDEKSGLMGTALKGASHVIDLGGALLGKLGAEDTKKTVETAVNLDKPNATRSTDSDPYVAFRGQLPAMRDNILGKRFKTLSKVLGFVLAPVSEKVSNAVFDKVASFAERVSHTDSVLDRAGVNSLAAIRQMSDAEKHNLAEEGIGRNRVLAAVQGVVTGVAGVAGAVIDVPLVLILSMRTIYQVAASYGVDLSGDAGRQRAFDILSKADLSTLGQKQAVILSMSTLRNILEQGDISGLNTLLSATGYGDVVQKLADEASKHLNFSIDLSWLSRFVPLVSSATGAYYNTRIINTIAALADAEFSQSKPKALLTSPSDKAKVEPSSETAPKPSATDTVQQPKTLRDNLTSDTAQHKEVSKEGYKKDDADHHEAAVLAELLEAAKARAAEKAQEIKTNTADAKDHLVEKVSDIKETVVQKASDVKDVVADKASDVKETVHQKAADVKNIVQAPLAAPPTAPKVVESFVATTPKVEVKPLNAQVAEPKPVTPVAVSQKSTDAKPADNEDLLAAFTEQVKSDLGVPHATTTKAVEDEAIRPRVIHVHKTADGEIEVQKVDNQKPKA